MKRQRSYVRLETVNEENPEHLHPTQIAQDQLSLLNARRLVRKITSVPFRAKASCCLIILVVVICEGPFVSTDSMLDVHSYINLRAVLLFLYYALECENRISSDISEEAGYSRKPASSFREMVLIDGDVFDEGSIFSFEDFQRS
jgi:hypothetical protein